MRTALLVLVLAALAGCTVDVGAGSSPSASALGGTVGVLEIERQADAENTLITAAFARYQGLSESDVLPLIGTPLLGSGTRTELDACVLVDGALDAELRLDSDVELIDAGTVEVRLSSSALTDDLPVDLTTRLVPRTFPDVASVMAGVFYAGETNLPLPARGDAYTVRSLGSSEVGAFELSLSAPSVVEIVVYGDDDGAVARDHALEFAWLPASTGEGDLADVLEIELASRGGTLACRVSDDGSFRIAPSLLAGLAADSDGELLVRRVRTRSFAATGIDAAYARLAITRTERVVVR